MEQWPAASGIDNGAFFGACGIMYMTGTELRPKSPEEPTATSLQSEDSCTSPYWIAAGVTAGSPHH